MAVTPQSFLWLAVTVTLVGFAAGGIELAVGSGLVFFVLFIAEEVVE